MSIVEKYEEMLLQNNVYELAICILLKKLNLKEFVVTEEDFNSFPDEGGLISAIATVPKSKDFKGVYLYSFLDEKDRDIGKEKSSNWGEEMKIKMKKQSEKNHKKPLPNELVNALKDIVEKILK